jgi:hypothetical protein
MSSPTCETLNSRDGQERKNVTRPASGVISDCTRTLGPRGMTFVASADDNNALLRHPADRDREAPRVEIKTIYVCSRSRTMHRGDVIRLLTPGHLQNRARTSVLPRDYLAVTVRGKR